MARSAPRILISGSFAPQNFERCWLDWLQSHQFSALAFDQNALLGRQFPSKQVQRLMWHFMQKIPVSYLSKQIIKAARLYKPDLVLVVSGRYISSVALQTIRQETGAALFHYYCEDFFNPLNTTRTLREAARFYDHFFTTKSYNVPEMANIGLNQVSYIPSSYIPNCHTPCSISKADLEEFGSDLSFVGTFETERSKTLSKLIEFNLRIWGDAWQKAQKDLRLDHAIQNRAVYCQEMSKVFNASKINLAFLRKANRDLHTTRTFEIPACGGFQLSERTDEVLGFFEEGKEIECFGSVAELKDKARYYLVHEAQRRQIAAAGLARVQSSSYSYPDRLQIILDHYLHQLTLGSGNKYD